MAQLECPNHDMNFLSPNGFLLKIERLPRVSFFSQSVQLPSISLTSIDEPTRLSRIKIPGDMMNFDPLTVPFIVDENMLNYLEVFGWMTGLTFPEDYNQYISDQAKQQYEHSAEVYKNYSDAKLFVLNSHNNVIRTFNFIDCFPTNLDGISFDSKNMDVTYVTCNVTFDYTYFNVE